MLHASHSGRRGVLANHRFGLRLRQAWVTASLALPSSSRCKHSGSREYRHDPECCGQSLGFRVRPDYGWYAWCGFFQNAL